jgi:DnaK suppressor protein
MANASFSKSFLSEIQTLLEEKKAKLETELGGFASKNPKDADEYDANFPEYGDEDDDNAREVAEYTSNKPLEIALEKELRDIKKALKRLADGTYGVCKYCDRDIDERRLRARPTSGSCVACKKALTNEV